MWPHRRQPTRLPHPWDSPGKNTGVGCHFLLQCMKVKSESEVARSCPSLSDPMDCSLPGSSVHGIFQARVLEWGAIAFSDIKALYSTNNHSENIGVKKSEDLKVKCMRNWQPCTIPLVVRSIIFNKEISQENLNHWISNWQAVLKRKNNVDYTWFYIYSEWARDSLFNNLRFYLKTFKSMMIIYI